MFTGGKGKDGVEREREKGKVQERGRMVGEGRKKMIFRDRGRSAKQRRVLALGLKRKRKYKMMKKKGVDEFEIQMKKAKSDM